MLTNVVISGNSRHRLSNIILNIYIYIFETDLYCISVKRVKFGSVSGVSVKCRWNVGRQMADEVSGAHYGVDS